MSDGINVGNGRTQNGSNSHAWSDQPGGDYSFHQATSDKTEWLVSEAVKLALRAIIVGGALGVVLAIIIGSPAAIISIVMSQLIWIGGPTLWVHFSHGKWATTFAAAVMTWYAVICSLTAIVMPAYGIAQAVPFSIAAFGFIRAAIAIHTRKTA